MELFLQEKLDQTIKQLEKTESWLLASEDQVRVLIGVIPAGLLIASLQGKIEAANPRCLELFNCSYERLIGCNFKTLFEQENINFQQADLKHLLEANNSIELMALRHGGNKFRAQITLRSFSSSNKQQLLVLIEDVSKRFELDCLKKEFIAMVSHDLRSPLTSISCFLEAIATGIFNDRPQLLQEKAESTAQVANNMLSLINTLLDIDKLEAGRLKMDFNLTSCQLIMDESLRSISDLAESRQVKIESIMPETDPLIFADSKYIAQVLVNLLANALKFSPRGSKVELKVQAGLNEMKFQVKDQGPGIPAEFTKRIFNRFEQVSIKDARLRGGSGLGLSICKQIVEQHGGSIGVDSEEGKGSTFWFTLPSKH